MIWQLGCVHIHGLFFPAADYVGIAQINLSVLTALYLCGFQLNTQSHRNDIYCISIWHHITTWFEQLYRIIRAKFTVRLMGLQSHRRTQIK